MKYHHSTNSLTNHLIQSIESDILHSSYLYFPAGTFISMYNHRQYSWTRRPMSTSSSHHTLQSLNYSHSSFNSSSRSRGLLGDFPSSLDNHAILEISRRNNSICLNTQPISDPHKRFVHRAKANCPQHLTQGQQTRWLKAGHKAQENQRLLSNLELFRWPTSNYDTPVHIHYRTPESFLHCMMSKISHVHLFMIDTECDKPTQLNPHSTPALLQIQAIYDNTFSTVFLIETHHLPEQSSSLFQSIQKLCQIIFSSSNKILAWGDVLCELKPFVQFDLFQLSQVTDTLNVQDYFKLHWNRTHPHTPECIAHHSPVVDEPLPEDCIDCVVDSNDLEDDFDQRYPSDDHNTCRCPDDIRPYKQKNPMWSLQKAIQHVFHQALDKSMTQNFWSCGLDVKLNTSHSSHDKQTRQCMIEYALNDLFAPTSLFFYFKYIDSNPVKQQTMTLNTIQTQLPNTNIPSFFVLSDSHGKYFPPVLNTPQYTLTTQSISGLQWVNIHNHALSTRSQLTCSHVSSNLSSSIGILLLIGTNSVRSHHASHILSEITEVISLIRSIHSHLQSKQSISIVHAFPCLKISKLFPYLSSLAQNIVEYNIGLDDLSNRLNFTVINLNITETHLHEDGMHINYQYQSFLFDNIRKFVDVFFEQRTPLVHPHCRSRVAVTRRNKKRLIKLREKQRSHTVIRLIDRDWKLRDLKDYLKYKQINFTRLPEVYNHRLRIQFNTLADQQYAEKTLSSDDFTSENYQIWIAKVHPEK